MYRYRSCYLMICLLVLITSLVACGSSTSPSTSGSTGTVSPTNTPPPNSNSAGNTPSSLSFTASGDLTGMYTFTAPPFHAQGTLQPLTSGTGKILSISVYNQSLNFALNFLYTGPGSYKLVGNTPNVQVLMSNGAKQWQLLAPSSCSVIVTADTPVTESGGAKFDIIKGSFTCQSLKSDFGRGPAVSLSNGQFNDALSVSS